MFPQKENEPAQSVEYVLSSSEVALEEIDMHHRPSVPQTHRNFGYCSRRSSIVEGFKDLFKKLHAFALSADNAPSTCSKLFRSQGGRKSVCMFTCLVPSGCVWAKRTLLTRESPMDVVEIVAELVVSEL